MEQEIALTIKPTMNCNMRCRHCFNGDDLNYPGFADFQTVCRFVEITAKNCRIIKLTFHGGEPTLAGENFYRDFYEFENRLTTEKGTKFLNRFTTNGKLLSENLADILIANNTLINVSFDGPFNSFLRDDTESVYEKITMLKSKKARLRIFCTLSSVSLGHLQEVYEWFKREELDFKILPIEPRGRAKNVSSYLLPTEKFVPELVALYKYWLKDKSCKIKFYTFRDFAKLRRDIQFKPFWFNREIALNPDGKIYPFGRPNDVNFCLGKPQDKNDIADCFNSEEYKRLVEILKNYHAKMCNDCPSQKICNGVLICMSYMYGTEEKMIEFSCRQANAIFQGILEINEKVAEDFRIGKSGEYNSFIHEIFSAV